MFDFKDLRVYSKAREVNLLVYRWLKSRSRLDHFLSDQLKRACISVVLNIAEGTGRVGVLDRKKFYIIARGSIYECVALIELLKDLGEIDEKDYDLFYGLFEQVSKMLWKLILALKVASR